jgi:glycerophosphoryl diester phosphodiesterase
MAKHNIPYPLEKRPLLFAHRGVSSLAPENTLSAFRKALDLGIPGIELDIHLCASGELVVTHDHNLKRVTGKDALVETLDLQSIQALDSGSWKSEEFKGEKIPTLAELFDLVGGKMYYDIEIKSKEKEANGLEEKLVALIEEYGLARKVAVTSFNPLSVKRLKAICPTIPTAVIYSNSKELPLPLRFGAGSVLSRCDFLKPSHKKVNLPYVIARKHLGGREIIPWTIDDLDTALALLKKGASGIITNRPQDMLESILKLQDAMKAKR